MKIKRKIMIDMEIAIILLSTILTYIYISYIFAKSKLNETYYLTDVIDENINNFFAVATLLSLNLFMINNLFKTIRSEEHTSELQSRGHLVCRHLLEKKK